jgi:hypothetical protein
LNNHTIAYSLMFGVIFLGNRLSLTPVRSPSFHSYAINQGKMWQSPLRESRDEIPKSENQAGFKATSQLQNKVQDTHNTE